MNTTRSILSTSVAALTVGLILGGGVAVAATSAAPPRGAIPDCTSIALDHEYAPADRLERMIEACLNAVGGEIGTIGGDSVLLPCRLREIANRPWTADTIDRRLSACSSAR